MIANIRNWIFSLNCFKCHPIITNVNKVSTATILCAKKVNIKNNFTFHEGFQRNIIYSKEDNEHTNSISDLFSEEKGYVSADLLERRESKQRKHISMRNQKCQKPSLTYKGEILFGVHPVYLALLQKKRTFYQLYTREEDFSGEDNLSKKSEIIKLAESMDIPISWVDSRGLRILAPGAVHQGVCLDAGFYPLPSWNEEQDEAADARKNRPLWLVLDEILDPMNVGAIIRSAHYFGVEKIFTVRGYSCKLSPTVSKASSGSLEAMDIYQIDNLEDFVKRRKENGWRIVSTLAYSENKSGNTEPIVSANKCSISTPTVLVLGNEGRGVSKTVINLCDSLISIEPGRLLPHGIDSLNVSVATGVVLYILNSSSITR